MLLPLVILAIFTCIIGLINVPKATPIFSNIYETYEFKHFLEHSLLSVSRGHSLDFNLLIAGIALVLGIASIVVAHNIYKGKGLARDNRDQLERHASSRVAFRLANARLYLDEIYGNVIEQPFNLLATFLADRVDWDFLHNYFHDSIIKRGFDNIAKLLGQPFDLGIIDGAVNGIALLVQRLANWMRGMQTGYVRMLCGGDLHRCRGCHTTDAFALYTNHASKWLLRRTSSYGLDRTFAYDNYLVYPDDRACHIAVHEWRDAEG